MNHCWLIPAPHQQNKTSGEVSGRCSASSRSVHKTHGAALHQQAKWCHGEGGWGWGRGGGWRGEAKQDITDTRQAEGDPPSALVTGVTPYGTAFRPLPRRTGWAAARSQPGQSAKGQLPALDKATRPQ